MRALSIMAVTLVVLASPVTAQDVDPHAMLDRLRSAPKPEGQKDLDTLALASAQREKADSMTERTNGLWQSWVVAICQGCGVRERQYSKADDRALEDRAGWQSPGDTRREAHKAKPTAGRIVIRPFAMLEERKPAIVIVGRHGAEP
jgi:hypothetical protein